MRFYELIEWGSSYSSMRRPVMRLWRRLERVRRAALTSAVLVVRNDEGRVLVLRSSSGTLQLPIKQLHARASITMQVEAWLQQLLHQHATPLLVAIDGTPGEGITFLYAATGDTDSGNQLWLDPEVAASGLGGNDIRLLRLCAGGQ
jgi:hypothetical protein